ncbi:RelA/SpoT domain-containing protein [Bradyrhizobium sp.]|uniref:GTP pyrophosphokinase n=1 Tax=Bradyrhizobium sp. TaxID=376 RepID=UPI002E0BF6DC|nr:RelA/SpoT domain-containing protein [Bradyrhizobium sp.]
MLKKQRLEHLSVEERTKSVEGALEKVRRKEYSDPKEQLTDLSGVRVVTYLEEEALQISKAIRALFNIDEQNSHDRSADLGEDRIGYRSTHFVCSLGKERDTLPEYEGIGTLKFEVQIRTVLQHAWAELAHDRSFKFGVALPTKIQRKLNLYSGMLKSSTAPLMRLPEKLINTDPIYREKAFGKFPKPRSTQSQLQNLHRR